MPVECPTCPEGISFDDFVVGGQLYQQYYLYCALATAAANFPGSGPFQPIGVYTVTTDEDYIVPADASLIIWDVPTQSQDRTIDFSLVPAGSEVQVHLLNSGGFSVNEINGVFSLNETAPRDVNVRSEDGAGSVVLSDGTAAQYNIGSGATDIPQNQDVVHIAGTETITGAKTFSANARFNAFLGIGAAPSVAPLHVEGTAAGGIIAYFRSNAASFPNTQVILDVPANATPIVKFQENTVDKIALVYNSSNSGSGRSPDTFEIYSFVSGGPIVRVHESAPALSLAINSSGGVSIGPTGTPIPNLITGVATMAAGTTGSIADTLVATGSPILVTPSFAPLGTLYVQKSAGVGFTILSTNPGDAGQVNFQRATL